MSTAGNIVDGALRLLSVLAEGESPTAQQTADGLTSLQDMVAEWELGGVFIDAESWVAATTVTLPNSHIGPLKAALALYMADEYSVAPSANLYRRARRAERMLKGQYTKPLAMGLPTVLTRRFR